MLLSAKKALIREEFGFLCQDFEPVKATFLWTFTKTPLSIFGTIFIFLPCFLIAALFLLGKSIGVMFL